MIIDISGKKIIPRFDISKPEGNKARCADYSKAERILGWEPKVGLKDGLGRCYEWIEKSMKSDEYKRDGR